MFTCPQCNRQFETEGSLRSHCAWHNGILRAWKDAAAARESSGSRAFWIRNGKGLVKDFLKGVLADRIDPPTAAALRDSIYETILAALK